MNGDEIVYNTLQSLRVSLPENPEEAFRCTKCSYTGKSEFLLKSHQKTHRKNNYLFRCPHCDFIASSKNLLSRHGNKVHSSSKNITFSNLQIFGNKQQKLDEDKPTQDSNPCISPPSENQSTDGNNCSNELNENSSTEDIPPIQIVPIVESLPTPVIVPDDVNTNEHTLTGDSEGISGEIPGPEITDAILAHKEFQQDPPKIRPSVSELAIAFNPDFKRKFKEKLIKDAQKRFKSAPIITQEALQITTDSPESTQNSSKSTQNSPKSTQNSPKSTQSSSKSTQNTSESTQNSSESTPNSPKSTQISSESTESSSKSAQNALESTQNALESTQNSLESIPNSPKSPQNSPKSTQSSSKSTQNALEATQNTSESTQNSSESTPNSPKSTQNSSESTESSSKSTQNALKSTQNSLESTQSSSESTPKSPKSTQNSSESTESSSKSTQNALESTQNSLESTQNSSESTQNSPKSTQNSPKSPQNSPKSTQNSPKSTQNSPKSTQNSPDSTKTTLTGTEYAPNVAVKSPANDQISPNSKTVQACESKKVTIRRAKTDITLRRVSIETNDGEVMYICDEEEYFKNAANLKNCASRQMRKEFEELKSEDEDDDFPQENNAGTTMSPMDFHVIKVEEPTGNLPLAMVEEGFVREKEPLASPSTANICLEDDGGDSSNRNSPDVQVIFLECLLCGFSSSHLSEIVQHKKDHHTIRSVEKDMCEKEISNEKPAEVLNEETTLSENFMTTEVKLEVAESCWEDENQDSQMGETNDINSSLYQCLVCPYSFFFQREEWDEHLKTHALLEDSAETNDGSVSSPAITLPTIVPTSVDVEKVMESTSIESESDANLVDPFVNLEESLVPKDSSVSVSSVDTNLTSIVPPSLDRDMTMDCTSGPDEHCSNQGDPPAVFSNPAEESETIIGNSSSDSTPPDSSVLNSQNQIDQTEITENPAVHNVPCEDLKPEITQPEGTHFRAKLTATNYSRLLMPCAKVGVGRQIFQLVPMSVDTLDEPLKPDIIFEDGEDMSSESDDDTSSPDSRSDAGSNKTTRCSNKSHDSKLKQSLGLITFTCDVCHLRIIPAKLHSTTMTNVD